MKQAEQGGSIQADAEKRHHQAERTELPENESPLRLPLLYAQLTGH